MNKPTHALIDGDILRYQLGAVTSKGDSISIGSVSVDVPQPKRNVRKLLEESINSILESTGTRTYNIYLSEGKNFRFGRATIQPYKGNRVGFIKPYHYKTVGEYIKELYVHTICEEFEADDLLAKDQDIINGTTVICSRDKDLRGEGGWHYSWAAGERSPEKPLFWMSEFEGKRWFYTQLLTGDSTDNIIGCGIKKPTKNGGLRRNGIGPKKAEEILATATTEEELFQRVKEEYVSLFGNKWVEHMKENGTLLYMSNELIPWEDLDRIKKLFGEN